MIEPKIVGDQTGLHPLRSLLAIYVGMKLGGVVAMILAPVPVSYTHLHHPPHPL